MQNSKSRKLLQTHHFYPDAVYRTSLSTWYVDLQDPFEVIWVQLPSS